MKNSSARLAIVGAAVVGASLVVADLQEEPSRLEDFFNWRFYDYYMSSRIATEADIVEQYQWEQRRFMPILLPDPEHVLVQKGGILPVTDWSTFPKEFVEGLVPVEREGITYWPIWVVEDAQANPRRRLFINAEEKIIGALEVPKDYDSAWYVKECYPHLYDGVSTAAETAFRSKLEAIYDGKRLIMAYELVDQNDLVKLVWQRSLESAAWLEGEGDGGMMMMGGGGDDLRFVDISPYGTEGAMSVTVAYPETFTGRISIIACDDLVAQEWSLLTTIDPPPELNTVTYVDEDAGSYSSRFYHAYNADYDGDGDGISDGQEHFLDGTDPEDENDPPNVKGTVSYDFYSGGQSGLIWVVAVTSSESWSTELSDVLDGPGAYHIVNLPEGNYYIKAFRDSDINGSPGTFEAQGTLPSSPLTVGGQITGIDFALVDPDTDADRLPDWWEFLHFEDLGESSSNDTEPDGLTHLAEYQAGTDPNVEDTGYIPNNKNGQDWPTSLPISEGGGAPRQEREYTFDFAAITSLRPNAGVARALAEGIDDVLIEAVANRANWTAYAALEPIDPGVVWDWNTYGNPTANANYVRRETFPTHTVFMDIYFDTENNLCYTHTAEYRMRRRFEDTERWLKFMSGDTSPVDPDLNNRIEFMSKVDRIYFPDKPGFSEVTESRNGDHRIPHLPATQIQSRINDFQDGRWSADLQNFAGMPSSDAGMVCNAAWKLWEYFLRKPSPQAPAILQTDIIKPRPRLILVQERRRQHLDMPGLQLSFVPGVNLIGVFIITIDSSHIYVADSLLAYMQDPANLALPPAVGSFVTMDVEFEQDTSRKLDEMIDEDPPRPDKTELEALRAAFLQDQETLINLIRAEFNDKPHDLTVFYSIKGASPLVDWSTHAQVSGTGVQRSGVQGILGNGLSFNGNGYVSYVAQAESPSPTVTVLPGYPFVLTEFQTRANVNAILDTDEVDNMGNPTTDREDWIEIQNVSASAQLLDNWTLRDSTDTWPFPNGISVPPGGFLIVFADDEEDPMDTDPPLHSNFRLSGNGEYLALVAPGGTIATEYNNPSFPDFEYDVSYGIEWNGSTWVEGLFNASPGEPNQGIYRRLPMELGNADFTISLWLKTTAAGVAVLSKSDTDGSLQTGEKQLYLDGSGKVRYFGEGAGYIAGNTVVNDGAWHHIAITFATATGSGKVYVDGGDDTDAMATTYSANADATGSNLLLGYNTSTQAGANFSGVLDEVVVWARTLSATEIGDIRTAGLQGSGLDTRAQLPSELLFHASMDPFLDPAPDGSTKYKRGADLLQP